MVTRARSIVFLVLALGGVAAFARGFRLVDTLGLLASGVLAGIALAQIAAARSSGRRRT
jgi:hypothetical protein